MNLYHCPNCGWIGLHEDLYKNYQTWYDGDYRDEYTSYTCPSCEYEGSEDDFEILDESEVELYKCPECGWTGFFDDTGYRCPVCATFYEYYDLLIDKEENE